MITQKLGRFFFQKATSLSVAVLLLTHMTQAQTLADSKEPGKLKIVCLGDSITGPTPGAVYLDKYIKWSNLIELALEGSLGAGKVEVFNRGMAGDTSSGVRAHLKERLLDLHPDIAIILIGANNFSPENTKGADQAEVSAKLKADVKEIVAQAKADKIRVLLLQYPEPKADNMEKVWKHGDHGNPVIAEVAKEEGVPVLDLRPAFNKAAQTQPLATLASPVDGIHLSPGGELVLTRAVVEKLRSLKWF